jgi:ribonuclease III
MGRFPPAASTRLAADGAAVLDLSPERRAVLQACETRLGHEFANPRLLVSALTHASSSDTRVCSNERMEFLGDAILGMVVCAWLFEKFPEQLEGDLTKMKSAAVSRPACARAAARLGLESHLILGKGMAAQAEMPISVLADCFESLIAAVYLDAGVEAAREFVLRHLADELEIAANGQEGGNHKSALQQLTQKDRGATPSYELLEERGPDHQKWFRVAAVIEGVPYPSAWGRNKKAAEQAAAMHALCQLRDEPIPENADVPD